MSDHLSSWQPRPRPERIVLEGRYVRLEPFEKRNAPSDSAFALMASLLGEFATIEYALVFPFNSIISTIFRPSVKAKKTSGF